MKLEIDTYWNNQKQKGKLKINFGFGPKAIFGLSAKKLDTLQKITLNKEHSILDQLEKFCFKNPNCLYALLFSYKTYLHYAQFNKAEEIFNKMNERFPEEVFTKCLVAERLLGKKKYPEFLALFNEIEAIKGAFYERKEFFYEEVLFFHNLWGRYHFENGHMEKAQKHKKFYEFIVNTLQNAQQSMATV